MVFGSKAIPFPWSVGLDQVDDAEKKVDASNFSRKGNRGSSRSIKQSCSKEDSMASRDTASTVSSYSNDVPRMIRASTARVEPNMIQERMKILQSNLKSYSEESNRCEYNLEKHVVSYLPTPNIKHSVFETTDGSFEVDVGSKQNSKRNLKAKSKFLRVQTKKNSLQNLPPRVPNGAELLDMEIEMDPDFNSVFGPNDMRLLALVAHNSMHSTMKEFVNANKNALKKFRLTGTEEITTMLKDTFKGDDDVVFGPICEAAQVGGNAQLVSMAVTGQLGGCIFFTDPMDDNQHSPDLEVLNRQGNIHNILMVNNPTTAHMTLNLLRVALKMGRIEMIPSFFFDLESPGVDAYKKRQYVNNAINKMNLNAGANPRESSNLRETTVIDSMTKADEQRRKYMKALQMGANVEFVKDKVVEEKEAPARKPGTLSQLGDHLQGHFDKQPDFNDYWFSTQKQSPYFQGSSYLNGVNGNGPPVPSRSASKSVNDDTSVKKKKPTTLAQLGAHLDEAF